MLQQVDRWLDTAISRAQRSGEQSAALRHARDRSLMLLGFWRGFRSDELVNLRVENTEVSRKNKLYFAFVELGKVIRTMFLLSYIGDVGLRKVIHAETNKSEQFNGFAGWSFFGGEGIIAENIRHEQRKVIKYNHLVANMIILHNVVGMTRALRELRGEGTEITPEILGSRSVPHGPHQPVWGPRARLPAEDRISGF